MQSLYDLASAWMKSPGAAGVVTPSATGFAGMVATAVAVWEAVKAYDAAVQFMGGRASRPYKSDHTTGHAFDFGGSSSQMAAAAAWLAMMNPNQDVKYIIHNPLGIWKPSTGWRPYTPAASVLKYAGESAWHRDHVHVSTYDQGGLLMPGLNIAYNGTGMPEPVISFADGGFSGFTGGTGTLKYSDAEAKAHDEVLAEYKRAEAAVRVYAAALEALAAQGASAEEQTALLGEQLKALGAERDAAVQLLEMARAAGATDEELADLSVAVSNLDTEIAGLNKTADAAAKAPLADAADLWAGKLSMLRALFDTLTQSSIGTAEALKLIPDMMAAARGELDAYIQLMQRATDASERMQYAQKAIAAVNTLFSLEREAIETTLRAQIDALDRYHEEATAAFDAQSRMMNQAAQAARDIASARQEALRDQHNQALEELRAYYDAQLDVMDEYERELDRRALMSEMQSLFGAQSKTTGDLDRIQAIRKQLAEGERTDARRALQDERDAAIKALKAQQEEAEKRLQAQIEAQERMLEAQRESLDAQRAASDRAYDEQRAILEANAQEQIDLAAEKYAKEIEIIMAMATDVTAAINEMTGVVIDSTLAKVDTTLGGGPGGGSGGRGSSGGGGSSSGSYAGMYSAGGAVTGVGYWDMYATEASPGAGYEWDPWLYKDGGGTRGAWKKTNYLSHATGEADALYGQNMYEVINPAYGIVDPYDPGLGGAYVRALTPEEAAERDAAMAAYYGSPDYAETQRLMTLFAARQRTYDDGGWLMPGVTLAANFTGRPERVVPPGGFHDSLDVRFHITTDGPITDAQAERLADVLERKLTLRQGRNARNQMFIRGR